MMNDQGPSHFESRFLQTKPETISTAIDGTADDGAFGLMVINAQDCWLWDD